MGITFACFNLSGKMPVEKEQFMMVVSGSPRLSEQDCTKVTGIRSQSLTSFLSSLLIIFKTWLISWPQEHSMGDLVSKIFQKDVVLRNIFSQCLCYSHKLIIEAITDWDAISNYIWSLNKCINVILLLALSGLIVCPKVSHSFCRDCWISW